MTEHKNPERNSDFSDTKKVFRKCGTCSRTFFHILDREFGQPKDREECAADLLAGGLKNTGHQCGMLWGATLAAGAESFRRYPYRDHAIAADTWHQRISWNPSWLRRGTLTAGRSPGAT